MKLKKILLTTGLIFIFYTSLSNINTQEVVAKTKIVTSSYDFYYNTFTYIRDNNNRLQYLYIDERGITDSNGKKINTVVKLTNNKKIRIKNGKVYSNGKLYTGKMNTKKIKTGKSLKKFEYMGYENQYYWNKFVVKKGRIVKGIMYYTHPYIDPNSIG